MHFNKYFKYVWWVIIIASGVYLFYLRYDQLKTGSVGSFDTVLIAILAALMLIPFFSEVDILGIKLKQEFTTLKSEVKGDMKEIKEVVRNVVDINNQNKFSPSIFFSNPSAPPDNQLDRIEEFIKSTMNQFIEQNAPVATEVKSITKLDVPDDNILLFSVRYNIEKEIRRIWMNNFGEFNSEGKIGYMPIHRMVGDLVKYDIIPPSFSGAIKETYAVCSSAIHGEKPTEKQVIFIKDIASEVISTLKVIR
ncbi:hypothetical protein [Paenibacillus sp. UNC217MF]|uniref:hypothetical protein n=1 Tax=Paenibacillus sp. UNC217MF TaxID=1449062 RepID=UPI00048D29FF|nr:hypothetical protein [Paenibacillus sp. UNC217MF]